MLVATPAYACRGEDEDTHTGHLPARRGQVMKFDWKLTTVVYTRARVPAGPESTHTHEQDITRRERSASEKERVAASSDKIMANRFVITMS